MRPPCATLLALPLLACAWLGLAAPAGAQTALDSAKWLPQLGRQLPMDLVFQDEVGKPVPLVALWAKRPVMLALVYFGCKDLCGPELDDLTRGLNELSLTAGQDFEVVAASIDPKEGRAEAASKRKAVLARFGRGASGWHFLTGDERAIVRLTGAVGFSFACDSTPRQFSHPAGVVAIAPGGLVSGYVTGLAYPPAALSAALYDAQAHREGSVVGALLRCFHYLPTTSATGANVVVALRLLGIATLVAMGLLIGGYLRRERRLGGGT